jgi:hypothetical protein
MWVWSEVGQARRTAGVAGSFFAHFEYVERYVSGRR